MNKQYFILSLFIVTQITQIHATPSSQAFYKIIAITSLCTSTSAIITGYHNNQLLKEKNGRTTKTPQPSLQNEDNSKKLNNLKKPTFYIPNAQPTTYPANRRFESINNFDDNDEHNFKKLDLDYDCETPDSETHR